MGSEEKWSFTKKFDEKRFHIALGIPEEGAWNAVFDEDNQMRGRQLKYTHILDRTFFRPRDIIKFCNEILKAHRTFGAESSKKFENRDIIAARSDYSEYLLSELDDEIKKHYPDYRSYIEVLKSLSGMAFTIEEFQEACSNRRVILSDDARPLNILNALFEFSIIGYLKPGGGGFGGSDYIWRHKDRRAVFNENARNFRVHPGFMEVLGLKMFTHEKKTLDGNLISEEEN